GTAKPGCRVYSTAPRLNSGLYFLLFDINIPFAHYQASLKCPQNQGRTPVLGLTTYINSF
ncbi:hypothetical protein, partial [Methylophaga sp. UBA2687]|uniref:hypothetical protein n=1 Tax=Methylophaga sp. UBA2687 TaxID=1946877 RepID=UPI0025EC6C84